jgi:hypothetical protein
MLNRFLSNLDTALLSSFALMNKIFSCFLLVYLFFFGNNVITAQSDTINELHPGDLEINVQIFNKKDKEDTSLITLARIDHIVTFKKQGGETSASVEDSVRHVYYETDDGELYLVLNTETTNVLVFTSPGHYSKSIFISLLGSSQTEYEGNMLMDMDLILGESKYRRVRKTFENEFAGIGVYSSSEGDISWDMEHQARLKKKSPDATGGGHGKLRNHRLLSMETANCSSPSIHRLSCLESIHSG